MPAIVLTRVDLPAPLSPTRPTTSWEWTSKSTPSSACTAPNLLVTPLRASSVAFDSIGAFLRSIVPPGRAAAPGDDSASPGAARGVPLDGLRNARGLARGCERLGADLGRRPEAVLDHGVLDVVLGDGDRRQEHGRHFLLAVVDGVLDQPRRGLLAVDQVHGDPRGDLSLGLDRLVDRHVLLTVEDPLDRRQLGVLPGGRPRGRVDA